MTETKEFHELFQQTSGRIFALFISTDGRGHYDRRGRLALDYCEAGQTFDLPKGMFDSDKYRATDVVLTFAKLEYDDKHKDEYLLVDVHSVKEPTIKTQQSTSDPNDNTPTERSGQIIFADKTIPIQQFFSDYQNRLTIIIQTSNTNAYPSLRNYSDLFYSQCTTKNRTKETYNNSAIREKLFNTKLAQLYPNPKSKNKYIDAAKEILYTSLIGAQKKPISSYPLPKFDTIFDLIDADTLQQIKEDWSGTRTLYSSRNNKVDEVTAGFAAKGLKLYATFLKTSPVGIFDYNLIYFGAPGTGKSYTLNRELEQFEGRYERVTFYSDYLHAQFVGSFRPQAVTGKDGSADFTYAFTPGPFTRALIDALNDADAANEHVLVIEEINRADPAAVFGDIFQLLDRDSTGTSTYPVTVGEDMKAYLWKKLEPHGRERLLKLTGQTDVKPNGPEPTSLSIAIPSNMLIWATMNSADQGVYPMDTAFKRRWNFRYIDINAGEDEITDSAWKKWRRIINTLLLTKAKVSEDKLLGPFFLGDPKMPTGTPEFDEAFKNKVIMYLFEDAAKYKRAALFNENRISDANLAYTPGSLTLQALFTAWDKIQFDIFNTPNE